MGNIKQQQTVNETLRETSVANIALVFPVVVRPENALAHIYTSVCQKKEASHLAFL